MDTPEVDPAPSHDDSGGLDGRATATIFDAEDVFDLEREGLAPEDLGDATDEAPAAGKASEEDGYAPDDELGAGGTTGPLVYYNGEDWIAGVPTRDDIVAEQNASGITETIRGHLDSAKPVFFMPTDIEETNEYANGYPTYALKLYGPVMDGSKAEVTVTGIDVFFDARVPDRPPTGALLGKAGQVRLAALDAPGAPTSQLAKFDAHLRQILADAAVAGVRVETVEAFPIRGYNIEKKPYKRVHLTNLQQRKKAIVAVRALGLETASDDRSSYYRKAAREYGLPLSDWAVLADYEHTAGPTERSPLCAHVFRVPVEKYRPLVDAMAPKAKRDASAAVKAKNPLLAKDRTLVLTWDIETHSDRGAGDVPNAQHDEDNAFMICMTAHWKDDPAPLKQVCLVDTPAAPDPRWTTVVCGTPKNVLKAFALVWRGFAPDIQTGFNDSDYDWPFVVEKARKYGLLAWMWNTMSAAPRRVLTEESVLRWNYARDKKIKISAEESFLSNYLKVPGCVPVDVRVCYKKLYPKGETPKAGSLKFYLEVSGLPGKADMPFTRMWRYYEEARKTFAGARRPGQISLQGLTEAADPGAGVAHEAMRLAARDHFAAARGAPEARATATARLAETGAAGPAAPGRAKVVREVPPEEAAEHMRHVAHYCVIDALRCQQLLVRRSLINDYREVSSLAFVSLFDSHYYAGGMKVCNLLGAYAWRRGILISMIPREQEESGKYPGAYVFPPEKGLTPNPDRLAAIDEAAVQLRALFVTEAALENALRAPGDVQAALADPGVQAAIAHLRGLRAERAGRTGPETPEDLRERIAEAKAAVATAKAAVASAIAAFAADRPVTGLDFASLYPSLIMTYNLSPEKILLTAEEAAYWESQGRTVHKIEFPFNGRIVRGWAIRHNNAPEDIGLFPGVLIDLFNKRAEVKGVLGGYLATKELIELITSRAKKDKTTVAEAVRLVLAEAEEKKAQTDAKLAPGAPPPRISPGATLAEEVADLKRHNKMAREQIEGIHKLHALARRRAAELGGAPAEPAVLPPDADLTAAVLAEYDRASFDWICANSKQNALKVFMNTFYGESGNSLGPFFLLPLAGGVTSSGQYNIKLVADFVRGRGFRIKYGDTDSLYLVCPSEIYAECDAEYVAGRMTREEWYSAMVRITIRAMNAIRDEVGAFLKADNGSPYLKMAYEEVLYPVVFTGKKKYFGIPHLNEVNFRPKKLFIKGIDVVKQGQPGLAREIGNRIMEACVALDNRRVVRQIVEDVLRDAVVNGEQWKFDHFIKTDAWKPHKNNIPVHRFIARMRARRAAEAAESARAVAAGRAPKPYLYELPEPGERFSYVIAKTGAAFDLQGRKAAMKKGDRMEFARAAKALGLEVDVAFYMVSYVVGLCARFINGDAAFQPAAAARLTEKKVDETAQKAAKKALENFVKGLSNLDSGMLRRRGYAYRRAYGRAATAALGALVERVGSAGAEVLHGRWLDFELFGDEGGEDEGDEDERVDPSVGTVEALWGAAGNLADAVIATDGDDWNEALGLALGFGPNGADAGDAPTTGAKRLYATGGIGARGPARRRPTGAVETALAGSLARQEALVRAELAARAPAVADVALRYEADLSRLVHHMRLDEHGERPEEIGAPETGLAAQATGADPSCALFGVTEADRATLVDMRRTWFTAVGIQLTRRRAAAFAAHVTRLKDKRLRVVAAPPPAARARAVAEAAAKLRPRGDLGVL